MVLCRRSNLSLSGYPISEFRCSNSEVCDYKIRLTVINGGQEMLWETHSHHCSQCSDAKSSNRRLRNRGVDSNTKVILQNYMHVTGKYPTGGALIDAVIRNNAKR